MINYRKIINSFWETGGHTNRSYAMIETLILKVLAKHIKEQHKEFYSNFAVKYDNHMIVFDGFAPLGFDNYDSKTLIEIKLFRTKQSINRLANKNYIIDRMLKANKDIKNVIFLFILDLSEDEKKKFISKINIQNINVDVWDMKKIEELFEKHSDYVIEISEKIVPLTFDTTIFEKLNEDDNNWLTERNEHIINLRKNYYDDELVLFLGAGISKDAKISTWDQLVSDLLVSLVSKKLENYNINLTDIEKDLIISQMKNVNGSSPLLQARYIRTGLEDVFTDILTEILYKDCVNTSKILEEITQLCLPVRSGIGIKAVVTYNFDDLIEYNFEKLRIKHRSIYREGEMPSKDELGIFHVHGFLPRDNSKYENLSKGLLVFSEEGYHNLMLDSYNWANIVQLNHLRENVCLFIGLSMTDPNLRRLLDIAVRKQESDNLCKHYVILKREVSNTKDISNSEMNIDNIKAFDRVSQKLQEAFFKELGINIVWVDNHSEISSILKHIKE